MPSVFVLAGEENGPKRRKRRPSAACRVTFKKGAHGWSANLRHGRKTLRTMHFAPAAQLPKTERTYAQRELMKHCPESMLRTQRRRRPRRRKSR